MPHHVMIELDGVLMPDGQEPDGPLGDPIFEKWQQVRSILERAKVSLITWRYPTLVAAWMDEFKLGDILENPRFQIVNERPKGVGLGYVAAKSKTLEDIFWKLGGSG